ncbi:SDR family NAD(P)-dependent oxidoreductase [Rhodocytophaga aerolata]|uniref:SDR family NAD(P)-dependent oxidoreductase n=1 Tax=Rhodocytophaga aerolata TaxID=455078 RepID=A0ABT8R0I5_9BACT|nr:SDR family NAD(P)-dependent oxidoreductase [Rhodocytophaga aerolata]MDO1445444.1 SDR family NAD(P)-dependent oxidoreductase [Rhodocytophaga aerolata]
MNIHNQVIVITGGASGIGYAIIQELLKANTIVSLDRNVQKINRLTANLSQVTSIQADITDPEQVSHSLEVISQKFGRIDMLIHNAGKGSFVDFAKCPETELQHVLRQEIETNYMAPVLLTKKALYLLQKSRQPTVVFLTSGLAYMPVAKFAGYCAAKAAMHFFAMSLRHQLKDTPIKVIEVLPPTLDTDFNKGLDIPKMSPETFANRLIKMLAKGEETITIGQSVALEKFARFFPALAFKMLNKD